MFEELEDNRAVSLPSLYDFLLSQEKLASEIRRQNKELASVRHDLKNVFIAIEGVQECVQNSKAEPLPLSSSDEVLIHALDMLVHFLEAAKSGQKEILAVVPQKTGFWPRKKPAWRTQLEKVLQSHEEGVALMHDKLLAILADIGIEACMPEIGDAFDPALHRAIASVQGGNDGGSIAKVIRYGFWRNNVMLRFADVVIFT